MNKKNRTLVSILLILTIGLIGLTIAYFSNSISIENEFKTNPYGTTYTEVFVSPDNWLPGDTTDKIVTVINSGRVDEAVRISLTEEWKSKNGDILSGLIDENGLLTDEEENSDHVAIINFSNNADWTYDNGYYYYNYRLSQKESTSSLIKSVTFNSKTKLDDTCVTTTNGSTKTVTCNSLGNDYDNATYKLTINIETVQYNKYNEAWNLNNTVAISETKQRMLKGLKVNVADATFDNGDKTAMFEFSHPATAQTPTLVDYRYIGHMPNNYVKFNCDNDGTNCEIWRIIGVFSVDDGTGNWEQRIKLVRGSAFDEMIKCDDRIAEGYENYSEEFVKNEWDGSYLSAFLNSDYLTRQGDASNYGLTELAQSQIGDVKYYLGGGKIKNFNAYYASHSSTDEIYNWESGSEVFNSSNYNDRYCLTYIYEERCIDNNYCQDNVEDTICNANRSLFWTGKVGLLYPSDYGYTYSKEVENECFNDPSLCFEKDATPTDEAVSNHPESGWIYNSNNLKTIILLSSGVYDSDTVFYLFGNGHLGGMRMGSGINSIIRPVVYLKSSIQITGGEGTEQNPYTLSS